MGRRVTSIGLPLLVGGGLLLFSGLAATVDARTPASLRVVLIAAPRLTAAARGALIGEASRIWE